MVVTKLDDIDAYCANLRRDRIDARKARGACTECGWMPKPKRPQPGKQYCGCAVPKVFEAIAA